MSGVAGGERNSERLPARHEAYIYWAMIIVMTRRLARKPGSASAAAQPQITGGCGRALLVPRS